MHSSSHDELISVLLKFVYLFASASVVSIHFNNFRRCSVLLPHNFSAEYEGKISRSYWDPLQSCSYMHLCSSEGDAYVVTICLN